MISETEILKFYSEEMQQLLSWRRSMDTTRNLSVLIVAGMSLLTFANPEVSSHLILFLGSLTVFALLIFESRMRQFAAVSEFRLRALEKNLLAPKVDPSIEPGPGWEKQLAESLLNFKPALSFIEGFAESIYRNYFIIFVALDACWFSKLYLFPTPASTWEEFIHRPDFGMIPGWMILLVVVPVWISYVWLILWLRRKNKGKEIRY